MKRITLVTLVVSSVAALIAAPASSAEQCKPPIVFEIQPAGPNIKVLFESPADATTGASWIFNAPHTFGKPGESALPRPRMGEPYLVYPKSYRPRIQAVLESGPWTPRAGTSAAGRAWLGEVLGIAGWFAFLADLTEQFYTFRLHTQEHGGLNVFEADALNREIVCGVRDDADLTKDPVTATTPTGGDEGTAGTGGDGGSGNASTGQQGPRGPTGPIIGQVDPDAVATEGTASGLPQFKKVYYVCGSACAAGWHVGSSGTCTVKSSGDYIEVCPCVRCDPNPYW